MDKEITMDEELERTENTLELGPDEDSDEEGQEEEPGDDGA